MFVPTYPCFHPWKLTALFSGETNIPHLIGQCVEVIWKIVSDMLRDSNCSPMAPDPHRDWEYARHLRQYLGIATQVGFEDVTVVVPSISTTMAAPW